MLPMMILQTSDTALIDTKLNSTELLPQEPLQERVAFAAILESGLEMAPDYEQIAGTLLPPDGKDLPPENLDLATTSPVGPFSVYEEDSQLAGVVGAWPGLQFSTVTLTAAADNNLSPKLPAALPNAVANLTLPAGHPLGTEITGTEKSLTPTVNNAQPMPAAVMPIPDDNAVQGKSPLQMPLVALAPEKPLPTVVSDMEVRLSEELGIQERKIAPDTALLRNVAKNEPAPTLNVNAAIPHDADSQVDTARDLRSLQAPATTTPMPQVVTTTATSIEVPTGQTPQISALNLAPQVSQGTPQPGVEPTTQAPQLLPTVDVAVKSSAWGEQIGERVLLMTNNRLQSAEIRLTPAELGPLRVQLAVEDGVANVTFLAQSAVTREAIEQAMPRLRELLAENGLTLNQADIAEHGDGDVQQGNEGNAEASAMAEAPTDTDDESSQSGVAANSERSHDGLVDTFV